MFSNESCKNADACRYCWMCRHICPVAGSTGNEAWTPRARGLLVSMVERGTEFDASIAETMYKCSLCEACANDCVTGFKPSEYIREARTLAVANGFEPAGVTKAMKNLMEKNNIYGDTVNAEILELIDELPEKASILLYLGQTGTTRGFSTGKAMIQILKKADVDFTVLREEPVSGAFLNELMGYVGEVQQQAEKTAKAMLAVGAKTIVVLNPHDACIFKNQYMAWGLLPGTEVITATAYLAKLIADGILQVHKVKKTASFQDPCRLTRGLDETEPSREILNALGIELKELFLNKKMGRCCGGAVLNAHSPEVVESMVQTRKEDAVRIGSHCIITACPDCQNLMNNYGENTVEIIDLFELLNANC